MHYFQNLSQKDKNQSLVRYCIAMVIVFYGIHLRVLSLDQMILFNGLRSDALDFYIYAQNLKQFGIFSKELVTASSPIPHPDAIRPPLFPWLASWFSGKEYEFVRQVLWAQLILQIVSFGLLSLGLLRRIAFPIALPILTILWSFPHFITLNSFFLTDSLFLSLIALTLSYSLRPTLKQWEWGCVGLLIGIASLARPVIEYFPLFFCIFCLITKCFKREYAYFTVAALVPILAWKIRNLINIHAFGDPTLMANALYHGSFPDFLYQNKPETLGFAYRYDPEAWRAAANVSGALELIFERFLNEPLRYLKWYLLGKLDFFWQWRIFEGFDEIYIYRLSHSPWNRLPDMILVVDMHKYLHMLWIPFGLVLSIYMFVKQKYKENPASLICVQLIIYVCLVHIVVAPYTRYGIPFKLPLLILIALGVNNYWNEWQKKRQH